MGQYHVPYNIDKREIINPHGLGLGIKQAEFLGGEWSVGDFLGLLLAGTHEKRGGGDFATSHVSGNEQVIGRWAGDRVVVIGDYAHPSDVPSLGEEVYREAIETAWGYADGDGNSLHDPPRDITPLLVEWMEREPWCHITVTPSEYGWAQRTEGPRL